jgi:hypothetical protein
MKHVLKHARLQFKSAERVKKMKKVLTLPQPKTSLVKSLKLKIKHNLRQSRLKRNQPSLSHQLIESPARKMALAFSRAHG